MYNEIYICAHIQSATSIYSYNLSSTCTKSNTYANNCACTYICICTISSTKADRFARCSLRLPSFAPTPLDPVNAFRLERNEFPSCVLTLAGPGRMLHVIQTIRIQHIRAQI